MNEWIFFFFDEILIFPKNNKIYFIYLQSVEKKIIRFYLLLNKST